jgi:hypothetical protein
MVLSICFVIDAHDFTVIPKKSHEFNRVLLLGEHGLIQGIVLFKVFRRLIPYPFEAFSISGVCATFGHNLIHFDRSLFIVEGEDMTRNPEESRLKLPQILSLRRI